MRATVTPVEASQQLTRLMAVFPRHGLSEDGAMEYADSMTTIFAGEWHMRAVIDEAKRRFSFFPSIAQLVDLADDVSAKRGHVTGCPNCIRSMPGMAYQTSLWTPGADGKPGRIEPITDESAEAIRPMLTAQMAHAKAQGRQYDGQRIIERTDAVAAVGYCKCLAGADLLRMRLARKAQEDEKRAARNGLVKV